MAPLVSPFCSPLSSTSLERAGAPAGKHSRPIVARPYPRWTNRRHARRAKMNGSLSLSILLSLCASLSTILPTLFPHLGFGRLSRLLLLAYTWRASSVRRSVRSPFASAVVLTTLPYTLQRSNVSHGILRPSLSRSVYLCFSRYLLSLSLLCSFFYRILTLPPSYLPSSAFFLSFSSCQSSTFSEFLFRAHYSFPTRSAFVCEP